jgi:hypothetical protein
MSEYQELLESSQKTMLTSMPFSCIKRYTNKDVVEPVYIDLKKKVDLEDNISSESENTISFESDDNISSEPYSMSELCEDEEPKTKNCCTRNSYILIPIATFLMGMTIAGFTFSMIISSQIIKT